MSSTPDFIIAGAPKSGTTSLYYYIKQHPNIYLPDKKELHFFSAPQLKENANGPGDQEAVHAVCDSFDEYLRYFSQAGKTQIKGEVSPSYFVYPEVAAKIKDKCNDPKIIIILRNPIEKAFSQYCHLVKEGREQFSFEEALQRETERAKEKWNDFWLYTSSSFYFKRLQTYFNTFGRDHIKIILFDDFCSKTPQTLQEIFHFLKIEESLKLKKFKIYNRSGNPKSKLLARLLSRNFLFKNSLKKLLPPVIRQNLYIGLSNLNTGKKLILNPETEVYLKKKFKPDILEVEKLLNRKTGWI